MLDLAGLAQKLAGDKWPTWLLLGALAYFVAALGLDLARNRLACRFLTVGVIFQTTALLVLLLAFLKPDLSLEYVFTYTRADYPWWYRVAGVWAGQKGTLLMWAAFTGLFTLAFLRKSERAAKAGLITDPTNTVAAIRRVLLTVLILFTFATLVARTFAPTPEYLRDLKPDGNGLQPVLLTPFMIIHPPLQFVAYSLTGLLFAAGVAHHLAGGRDWATLIRPWARFTFLVATLGLGLGGLWAYYVLNFGGFWAWDPVETANLIAWFPTLLLLHALLGYQRGEYQTAAPLFAILTLPMALFATVATRTGLWVSVHAFTDPSKNFARDPFQRLLNILDTSDLLAYLAGLTILTLLIPLWATFAGRLQQSSHKRRDLVLAVATSMFAMAGTLLLIATAPTLGIVFQIAHSITIPFSVVATPNAALGLLLLLFGLAAYLLLTSKAPDAPKERPVQRKLLGAGVLLLSLAFLVTLLLELFGVNDSQRAVFDDRAPLVALPILVVMAAHFLTPAYGARRAGLASATAALTGAIAALGVRDHWHLLLVLPSLLLALFASLQRLEAAAAAGASRAPRARAVSFLLLTAALAAFVLWGNPPSEIDLALITLHPTWAWTIPAYALAAGGLLLALINAGAPDPRRARNACLLLAPLIGLFGLTTLAAAAALFLIPRSAGAPATTRQAFRQHRSQLRKASVYLLHASLLLGLVGYALATYESVEYGPLRASVADDASFDRYALRVLESRPSGLDSIQNLPSEIHVDVLLLEGGRSLEKGTLVYWLVNDGTSGHYDARVTVLRQGVQDVYIYPAALHTGGGRLDDHVHGASPAGDDVAAVDVTVKVLPGVGLVWMGLWTITLAMGAQLFLGGFELGRPTAATAQQTDVRPLPEIAGAGK